MKNKKIELTDEEIEVLKKLTSLDLYGLGYPEKYDDIAQKIRKKLEKIK